jgi:ABC-type uncharacterized transport system substrate-binding protein
MQRREFITLLGGAAATWPLAARAQGQNVLHRVGVLWHAGSQEEEGDYFTTFVQGFIDLGYVEGRTVAFEHRFANEQFDRFRALAAELVALKVDVLVTVTRPATAAAQSATKTIPIVFITVPDPVGNKFADSLAKPGRNLTGLANMTLDLTGKRLQLLKEMIPDLAHVALLVNPSDPIVMRRVMEEAHVLEGSFKIAIRVYEAHSPEEIEPAFDRMVRDGMQGMFSSNDSMFFNERQRIANLALVRRLPTLLQNRPGAMAGALMSYGPDSRVMFRRAAAYVDKIFKGEKPGDLPIEQPTRFELLINLKTAKSLGLSVPLTLQAAADEVIE